MFDGAEVSTVFFATTWQPEPVHLIDRPRNTPTFLTLLVISGTSLVQLSNGIEP